MVEEQTVSCVGAGEDFLKMWNVNPLIFRILSIEEIVLKSLTETTRPTEARSLLNLVLKVAENIPHQVL